MSDARAFYVAAAADWPTPVLSEYSLQIGSVGLCHRRFSATKIGRGGAPRTPKQCSKMLHSNTLAKS